jgi:hypothetical protein
LECNSRNGPRARRPVVPINSGPDEGSLASGGSRKGLNMQYRAKSLEDIAAFLDQCADRALGRKRAEHTKRDLAALDGEARAYAAAADLVRHTIMEPNQ